MLNIVEQSRRIYACGFHMLKIGLLGVGRNNYIMSEIQLQRCFLYLYKQSVVKKTFKKSQVSLVQLAPIFWKRP